MDTNELRALATKWKRAKNTFALEEDFNIVLEFIEWIEDTSPPKETTQEKDSNQ